MWVVFLLSPVFVGRVYELLLQLYIQEVVYLFVVVFNGIVSSSDYIGSIME
jgi:hypothetical protein